MIELILSMTIWGTLGMFTLWSHVSAIDIAFYRSLIGTICIGIYLLKSKQKINVNNQTPKIVLAGLFIVLNWVLLFKSFQISSITIGNMSYYLQPIILVILGGFFFKERISFRNWILILLSFIGVVLTLDINNLKSPTMLAGAGLALLAALLYAFVTILMKKVQESYFQVIFIQLLFGTIILLPFTNRPNFTLVSTVCLIIIGLIHTVLAYFLYYRAIKKVNFTTIAVLSYLDPVVAIFTDIIFFHRTLNIMQICGICMTFIAAYILVTNKTKT